jgi:hypothetical protein
MTPTPCSCCKPYRVSARFSALCCLTKSIPSEPFPRVQDFASYCRLIKCAKESNGKRLGTSGSKMGHAHLKWAFSEAAV